MIPLSSSKLINSVLAELPENEWRLLRWTRHAVIQHIPTGRVLSVPTSPSCRRAELNFRAQVRRTQNARPLSNNPRPLSNNPRPRT